MKKLSFILLLVINLLATSACSSQENQSAKQEKGDKVEVFYFHFSRRCMTCNAVEAESKKAVEALYPEQYKSGKISFTSLNLDEESSKKEAERCKAEGQALLIVSGTVRKDLTTVGFMNARTKPEKLKAEMKKAIDPLL